MLWKFANGHRTLFASPPLPPDFNWVSMPACADMLSSTWRKVFTRLTDDTKRNSEFWYTRHVSRITYLPKYRSSDTGKDTKTFTARIYLSMFKQRKKEVEKKYLILWTRPKIYKSTRRAAFYLKGRRNEVYNRRSS